MNIFCTATIGRFTVTIPLEKEACRVLDFLTTVFNDSDMIVSVEQNKFMFGASGAGYINAYTVATNGKTLLFGILQAQNVTVYVTDKSEYRDTDNAIRALREYFGVSNEQT